MQDMFSVACQEGEDSEKQKQCSKPKIASGRIISNILLCQQMTVHLPHSFNRGRGWISETDSTPASGFHAE